MSLLLESSIRCKRQVKHDAIENTMEKNIQNSKQPPREETLNSPEQYQGKCEKYISKHDHDVEEAKNEQMKDISCHNVEKVTVDDKIELNMDENCNYKIQSNNKLSIININRLMKIIADLHPLSYTGGNDWKITLLNCMEFLTLSLKFGSILFYFYLCDRTDLFMQENKVFDNVLFYLALLVIVILGLVTIKKSKQTELLHRNQTEEWKGWMQLVILIYHYTGASQNLGIYMHIRILVSSYLFLTGFGHTLFFISRVKVDTPLFHRGCLVLFRLNFLTVFLCLVMDKTYQFYYFVPLVSFWFVVTYFLTVVGHLLKKHERIGTISNVWIFLILTLILTTVITVLGPNKKIFWTIFSWRPLKHLFADESGSIAEWMFRWELDKYSAIYGMYFAILLYLTKQKFNNCEVVRNDMKKIILTAAVAGMGIFSYAVLGQFCSNKRECNAIHPYVTIVPILSFVAIRNIHPVITKYYSAFFSWIGKISLELFVCQYHIWLAADTKGLLVIIPGYPTINLVLTTLIFTCVAHEIHYVTQSISNYSVPKETKKIARNLIFLVIFVYYIMK